MGQSFTDDDELNHPLYYEILTKNRDCFRNVFRECFGKLVDQKWS